MPTTDKETILSRIQAGKDFVQQHVYKAQRAQNRYLDSSAQRLNLKRVGGDGKPFDTPVGEVNHMAINIRQKVSSTAINNPDWQMDSVIPEAIPLARDYVRKWWHKRKWGRIFRRALTTRYIAGMAHVAYSWDKDDGFVIEYVKPDDFIIDPHTTDETWDNPRWAAKRIHLPYDIAHKRYGEAKFQVADGGEHDQEVADQGSVRFEKNAYEIWVYYDADTECELYGNTVLKKSKNLYDRVPIRTLQGDVTPDGEFALGDYDTTLGVYEMRRRLGNIINSTAQHGGGTRWVRSEFVDQRIREGVEDGSYQGTLIIKGVPGDQAVGYTPNMSLNPSVLEADRMLAEAQDSDQGVTQYDRGVLTGNNPAFATQAALLANRSGARGNQARSEYETFVEDIVNELIRLTVKFGLDPSSKDNDPDDVLIWQALGTITSCRIIEESTTFLDPATKQQQAMQLFNLAIEAFPLMNALGTAPNLKALFDEILRAYDRRDVDKYYINSGGVTGGGGEQPGQASGVVPPPGQPQGVNPNAGGNTGAGYGQQPTGY